MILKNFLPRKTHFMGIDVGTHEVKVAEVKVIDGEPEVVALRRCPSPQGVWSKEFDEEKLVEALKEIANPRLKEVITCIGGENVIGRIVRLPPMEEKELEKAVRFEVERFVPTPVDQLIIRSVWLEEEENESRKTPRIRIFIPRTREVREIEGVTGEGRSLLILAVPAAVVYQYHSIFSRAGLLVTAVDLQAFALWRLFGRGAPGTVAIADIGAKNSHLVVVREGIVRFLRLLPVGGNAVTAFLANTYGVEFAEAEKMKLEAAASREEESSGLPGLLQASDLFHGGIMEIARELKRSLEFYSAQEKVQVERVILSGGAVKLKELPGHLQESLGIPVEVGLPDIRLPDEGPYDPAYAVAIGLALREVV
ncbi:pilus assembly protein PilM [Desulfofundulus kuznetsovii]|uniref:pilus assembly protein PilM n=1 Tax=Desulfofundulus kuznetsovii TaxID=58135 RepID=UPI003EBC101E